MTIEDKNKKFKKDVIAMLNLHAREIEERCRQENTENFAELVNDNAKREFDLKKKHAEEVAADEHAEEVDADEHAEDVAAHKKKTRGKLAQLQKLVDAKETEVKELNEKLKAYEEKISEAENKHAEEVKEICAGSWKKYVISKSKATTYTGL